MEQTMNENQNGAAKGGSGKIIAAIIVLAVLVVVAYVLSMGPKQEDEMPVTVVPTSTAPKAVAPVKANDTPAAIQESLDSVNVGDLNADLKGIDDSLKNL